MAAVVVIASYWLGGRPSPGTRCSGGYSCGSCKASRIARYISTGSQDLKLLICSIAFSVLMGGRAGIVGSSIGFLILA